jgi:hypothetical protein
MMLKAVAQGAVHGGARGFAWGTVFVGLGVVFLQWVFG